jgi:hypothetical protein
MNPWYWSPLLGKLAESLVHLMDVIDDKHFPSHQSCAWDLLSEIALVLGYLQEGTKEDSVIGTVRDIHDRSFVLRDLYEEKKQEI